MQKRVVTVVVVAVLCLGAFAAAQAPPFTILQADRVQGQAQSDFSQWGAAWVLKQTTLTGNVVLEVNGVLVRADRMVVKDGEVELEGNVRMTLPKPK